MMVVAPLLRAIHGASASLTSFWDSYIDLREVRRQNLSLKEEVSRLKQEEMLLSEAKRENERLHRLLQMRDNVAVPTVAAMVIGKDPSNWFRSILIDKGAREGVSRDSAVLCPQGLVGRVIEVMVQKSRVQLINDHICAVGALFQRSRLGGVVVGEVGPYCRLKFLPRDAEVSVGDLVLTSGLGGLSPKGIPIGLVTAVQKKENALFQEAQLAPKVDLFRIEEVLVLAKPPRPEIRWREE